jgi:tRNA (guanine37-N1)-methyltransferase
MTIDILTLFPNMFSGPFNESIVKRATEKKLVTIKIHNLRDWAIDSYGTVDGSSYGGGVGMVLRPEPIFRAVSALKKSVIGHQLSVNKKLNTDNRKPKTVLLDAGGVRYTQTKANNYSKLDNIILICGHYEGVDYRVHEHLADEVISIGDYVLTGGEIPTMVLVDSVIRLIPDVLKKTEAVKNESFSLNRKLITDNQQLLLEYPQYTRPEEFEGHKVPKILLSGNHAEIEKWRQKQSLIRTKKNRPDLL